MYEECAELLVLMDPKVLLVKKAIVVEKIFKVLLEIKVNEASMGRVVSEEVILQMFYVYCLLICQFN